MPKPIFEVGNLQSAQAFLDSKIKQLQGHYFTELFTPFLGDHRTLKAAQVYEMKADLIGVFAPFGHRFLEEFVTNLLERVFMVLLRQGLFGPVPPEAIVGGKFFYPKVVHQSRMALEIQNLAKGQVRQFVQDIIPFATIAPEVLNHINFPQLCRLLGANNILMPGVIRTPDEVLAIEEEQKLAAQQQQAMEFAGKFGVKNPDHAAAALAQVA